MTISIDLPSDLEKHFQEIVQGNYGGDLQAAIKGLMELHDRYGWKEQLREDVDAVRQEVRRSGGIKSDRIAQTVRKYRKKIASA